ncbi:MAG: hypothetical protein HS111_23470 [Kofleriaceae bacterium]|nr:hypothetical protein [Kofleriaceae bacterium]
MAVRSIRWGGGDLAAYRRRLRRGGELTAAAGARLWSTLAERAGLTRPPTCRRPAPTTWLAAAAALGRDGDRALARPARATPTTPGLARRVRASSLSSTAIAPPPPRPASIDEGGGDGGDAPRVCGERAILAARDDRFGDEAMAHAWTCARSHRGDVLYLAERVLTIDAADRVRRRPCRRPTRPRRARARRPR